MDDHKYPNRRLIEHWNSKRLQQEIDDIFSRKPNLKILKKEGTKDASKENNGKKGQ